VEISKQEVGLDIEPLELASQVALSEATAERHRGSACGVDEESSSSSDTDDDDDDSSSSSSASNCSVLDNPAATADRDKAVSSSSVDSETHHLPLRDSSLVIANTAAAASCAITTTSAITTTGSTTAAAAAAGPAELVCTQLSSLTVSDEPVA